MASDELAPRRKHYSPSDEPEESPKRRKRHHHRRHHRSHRHRSKDDHEKLEKRDVATPPESSNLNMDEDKEEGEILEEEDQLGICEEPKKIMDSDVESGEIKADDGGQGLSDRKDDQKVICIEEHFVPRGSLEVLNLDMSKSGDKVGVCLMQPPKNALAVEKFDEYYSDCKVSGHREKKYEEDVSSSEKISNQSKVDVKLRESESTAGIRRGETCFEGDSRNLRRLARSKSPISKEILDPLKHSKTGESKSVFYDSKKHRERSVSPIKSKDKHVSVRRSPSINDRYHEDLRGRNRSRSLDHTRSDRSSLYSHDCNVGSREYSRIDYDHKRAGQHGVDDYHDSRDRWRDMESDRIKRLERERSSSYSRYSAKDEKYGSRNMDFVAENDKYRDKTGRASSHIQNDRERERGREKHRDLEREERKEEKRRDRFENRDIDRERWRDRSKDRRNGTDIDRERRRGRDQTRRSHTYGDLEDGHISHDKRNRMIAKDSEKEHNGHGEGKNKFGEEDEANDYEERIALKLAEQEEEDIEKIKEESRKRRQAILEKYKQQEQKQQQQQQEEEEEEDEMADSLPDVVSKGYMPTSNKLREQLSPSEANRNVGNEIISQGLENERDSPDIYMADSLFSVGKSPVQNGNIASEKFSFAGELDGTPKSEWLSDMFCDDIFGESPAVRKPGKGDGLHVEKSGLHDNWDDAEGYYSYRFGEILDGRYEVTAAHGKGVFSTVVRAKDLKAGKDDPPEVAIKIIRSNDTMRKAGFEELRILRMSADADLEDRRHCVRFITNFNYRNHLCLVFESLHMNLREVLKKFGRNIGLKLTAVRAYAKQLFIALKHLRNCGVLHSDIKPDNMLVNEAKNVLKLCDFGSAMSAGKNEITPYLVSRFYRAPEIILGLPYDHPMDMWSVGCCLYELYTGKVLFPGPSNNDMLRLHMELKGPFPKKMLRKGAFADQHFDQDLNFYATEEDPVTKKTLKKLLVNMKPKDVGLLIASSPGEDLKMVSNFKDLLDKIFILDPDKRLTVSQALSHPFITGK